MRRRKKSVIALAGLLAAAAVGSTIAYWSQTSTIKNPFDTNSYGSTIVEKFDPSEGENWQPGATVEKTVRVTNDGTTDMIVRARLDETWTRKGETTAYKEVHAPDVYNCAQTNAADGKVEGDKSVVRKNFSSSANWIDGGDGWYYYKNNLAAGAMTDAWLESVTLKADTDMGKFGKTMSVTDDADAATATWYPYSGTEVPAYFQVVTGSAVECSKGDAGAKTTKNSKIVTAYETEGGETLKGYSSSDYILTVTVETVQATQAAVNEMFGGGAGTTFTAPSACTWTLS